VALVPRWGSAGDIGKSEKVSSFICEGCQASFSREEGEQLRATEAERVRLGEAERLDKQ
jgi:transposase-like protein